MHCTPWQVASHLGLENFSLRVRSPGTFGRQNHSLTFGGKNHSWTFGGKKNSHDEFHGIITRRMPTGLICCKWLLDCCNPAHTKTEAYHKQQTEVENLQQSGRGRGAFHHFGAAMARVWWSGSLSPAMAVACTSSRVLYLPIGKPPPSLRAMTTLGMQVSPMSSCWRSISWRRYGDCRGMIARAVAVDSDFPEKSDVEQMEQQLSPRPTHEQADSAMGTSALTSVLPGFKFLHATAVVHPDAVLGEGVVVSAFCTVGPSVTLGNGCKLHAGSHICGNTTLGDHCELLNGAVVGSDIPGCTVIGHRNTIGYNAVVGVKCQDMKYKDGDECSLYIGNNNDIREHVSIHRSSKPNDDTVIGDDNLIMGSCHIAHDCRLGNRNILANGTLLGGHVVVQDYVHTGGAVAVHQFCHIDSYSFLAGGSMVDRDVPMYMMVSGDRAELRGLNLEGLRRCGFSDLEVKSIRRTYQKLFMNSDTDAGGLEDRLATLELNEELANVPAVVSMLKSVRNCFGEKRRGICKFRHWSSV